MKPLLLFFVLSFAGAFGFPCPSNAELPRNVILYIGDGMGLPQLGLLNLYALRGPSPADTPIHFRKLAERAKAGFVASMPSEFLVNDSACAATQYASGVACYPGVLGIDVSGQPAVLLTERAIRLGKATGLVSDTRITHATPAGFAVHVANRDNENAVAGALLDSGVNVLFSGGLRHFLPIGASGTQFSEPCVSKRTDTRDLIAEARARGYEVLFDRVGMATAAGSKILGLFACSGMADGIEESALRRDPFRREPTLRDMTEAALSSLQQNANGFFLMVEAGQIDWASHANDAGTTLHEMLRFDDTLGLLLDFVDRHPDTALLVTADHETGGLSLSYSAEGVPSRRKIPGKFFENGYQPEYQFVEPDVLNKLYLQKRSFIKIFRAYEGLPEAQRSIAVLKKRIAADIGVELRDSEAERLLARKANQYFVKDHEDLSVSEGPDLGDAAPFYPYIKDNQTALLGALIGGRLGIRWSTGTHTHSPVPLFVIGPAEVREQLSGFISSEELGRALTMLVEQKAK